MSYVMLSYSKERKKKNIEPAILVPYQEELPWGPVNIHILFHDYLHTPLRATCTLAEDSRVAVPMEFLE